MKRSLQTLLDGVVDYAGIFPPAGLPLADAFANYARYRAGDHSWMLGRFVVPVSRLDAVARLARGTGVTIPVSATLGDDLSAEFEAATRERAGVRVDCVEVRADSEDAVGRIARHAVPGLRVFVETPLEDNDAILDAIAGARLSAKIRTGGVTVEVFPPPDRVVHFILSCFARGVAFKATAGLHHPLCGRYPLTYEHGAPVGDMLGFLNVFLLSVFLENGLVRGDADRILQMNAVDTVRFGDGGISWENYSLSIGEIERARRRIALSFGSCSFDEPTSELRALFVPER